MNVRLVPVTDERYKEWLGLSLGSMSAADAARIFPDIRWIHGQTLRSIRDEERGTEVGFVWYGDLRGAPADGRTLHHLVIRESERCKGYGAAALRAVEEDLRRAGVERLDLEVSPACVEGLGLCRLAGFEEIAWRLQKTL